MAKQLSTSSGGAFDPRAILLVILLLIVMTALAGCRSVKQTSSFQQEELFTAQESSQSQTFRLDSIIKTFSLNADTLDIWVYNNTYPVDKELDEAWTPNILQEIVVTPDGTDTIPSLKHASGFVTKDSTPRIRTPTPSKESGLHIRVVGLQHNRATQTGSQSTEKCSQSSQEEHNLTTSQSDQRELKKRPNMMIIIPIALVIILLLWFFIHKNWSRIIKWFLR